MKDFDTALKRLDEPKLDFYRMSKYVLRESIEGLKSNDIDTDEYNIFKEILEGVLIGNISNVEGEELYKRLYYKLSNPNIKFIIDEIKLERHWDQEY